MGEKRSAYRVLVGKSEQNNNRFYDLGGWEDNIKMDIQEE
jgi:hypothetical protein